ncbi:MAG: hypothetical protein MJ216_03200 [Bacilli bacterium]|nr:hypothetical protein [Bacilli bacterium]
MKKYLITILSLIGFSLSACSNNLDRFDGVSASIPTLTIISPTGAPALGFYNLATSQNFETNADPTNIAKIMNAGQKDVVVLPTNAGVQNIVKNNAPYKIAATITFGNFYVASLNNDSNGEMDPSDVILLFQQNNVPDKLFHYIYGNDLNNGIHYVNAVSDVSKAIKDGFFVDAETGQQMVPNYVLIAEPALSALSNITIYADIQEKYREKNNDLDIYQASIFIKNEVSKDQGDALLAKLKLDIEDAISDSNKLLEGMNKVESASAVFGVAPQMAANVLKKNNGMGLGFKKAIENKTAIDQFLSLFNIGETNEEIYYK